MTKIVNCFCSINHYRPQRSCEGYVFTPVCHSVHRRGVCLSACWDTIPPEQAPPGSRHPLEQAHPRDQVPLEQTTPPPGTRQPPEQTPPGSRHPSSDQEPPPGRRLLLRTVRILLECILVTFKFTPTKVRYKVHI